MTTATTHTLRKLYGSQKTHKRIEPYIYRELYLTEHTVDQIATQIKLLDAYENLSIRYADPAIWKGAGNKTLAKQLLICFP